MDNVTPGAGDTPPIDPFARVTGAVPPKPKRDEIWEPQLPAAGEPPEAGRIRHSKHGQGVRHWVYRDATSTPLFCVVRFEPKKADGTPDKKQVIPYSFGRLVWTTPSGRRKDETGWHFKRPDAPVPLYGLDRLAARPDARVLLCEGEKAADAAERVFPDVVAIASQGGGNAPELADWSPLAGRDVTIWPDADAAGAKFVRQAAELLQEAGTGQVRVVQIVLAEWPNKWDLADALPAGTPAERLVDLLDGATEPPVASAPADDGVVDEDVGISSEDFIAEVTRLGALTQFDYNRERKSVAEALSVSLKDLDAAVKDERIKQQRAAMAPEAIAEEIDRLSRLPRAEYARDRKAAAQKLLMGVLDLDGAVDAERAKRRNAAEADYRAKPPPENGETRWPMGILPCEDGLYMDAGADTGPVWICAPLEVLGQGRDAVGESWGLWLKWRDADGRIHTWPMPKKMLMVQPGQLEADLSDRGLDLAVDPEIRAYLRFALNGVKSGNRVAFSDMPGWSNPGSGTGEGAFVLIDGEIIGEANEAIVLKSMPENAAEKMAAAGTLDGWKQTVATKAIGNPVCGVFDLHGFRRAAAQAARGIIGRLPFLRPIQGRENAGDANGRLGLGIDQKERPAEGLAQYLQRCRGHRRGKQRRLSDPGRDTPGRGQGCRPGRLSVGQRKRQATADAGICHPQTSHLALHRPKLRRDRYRHDGGQGQHKPAAGGGGGPASVHSDRWQGYVAGAARGGLRSGPNAAAAAVIDQPTRHGDSPLPR